MKLGANPESGLMQLPMLNPVLHPSQRSASVEERGVAPCIEFKADDNKGDDESYIKI